MKSLQHNNPKINYINIFLSHTGAEIFMPTSRIIFCSYDLKDEDTKRLCAIKKME